MGHGHSHGGGIPSGSAAAKNRSRLAWALALTLTYMLAEVIGGLLTLAAHGAGAWSVDAKRSN